MKFLPNKIISYQLYIFQLEEYEVKRFWKAILRKGLIQPSSLRKKVTWTQKAKLMVLISTLLQIFFSFALSFIITSVLNLEIHFSLIIFLLFLYLFILFSFVFLSQARDLLLPLENYKKRKLINKAKNKLDLLKKNNPKLITIGITGSYGKTTMKEVLNEILKTKFRIVSTFENQNTPIGIARKILSDVNERTEVFIVEMGEYVKGDVNKICEITPPDISIITGINEAHLERYLTMENAIDTKFEIVENTVPNGLVLLNADDELVLKNYKRFNKDRNIQWFSSKSNALSRYKVDESELDIKNLGLNFTIKDDELDRNLIFKTKFLAEYVIGNVIAGLIIGRELGMNDNEIKSGVSRIKPVEHRLEPSMLSEDIILIDDTYNGNSDGIREGINLLKKFKNKRKVYITPGLVETGSLAEEIHLEIGRQLAEVADLVVLLGNRVFRFLEKGFLNSPLVKAKFYWSTIGKKLNPG